MQDVNTEFSAKRKATVAQMADNINQMEEGMCHNTQDINPCCVWRCIAARQLQPHTIKCPSPKKSSNVGTGLCINGRMLSGSMSFTFF